MALRLPPMQALKAFEAAARTGSLSKAAQALHLTHGAISHQVKALERDLGVALIARAGVDGALITMGERGMWLSQDGVDGALDAAAREVADVTGAGDTVIATLALALAAGATTPEGATLANEAAGLVVGKFGAATVTGDELRRRFAI